MFQTISKTRLVMSIIGFFILSTYMSCQELKYMVRGKTADATVIDTHIEQERDHGRTLQKKVVGYLFTDGSTARREYADVPMDWSAPDSGTVKVQYLPGWELHSRLLGQNNMLWVIFFFVSLVAAGVGLWSLARDDGGVDDS